MWPITEVKNVDCDCLNFLTGVIFGKGKTPIQKAVWRAYLDFNRTLHGMKNLPVEDKIQFDQIGERILTQKLNDVWGCSDQESYDNWHSTSCNELIIACNRVLNPCGLSLFYVQAQKWINMTMKYLYILSQCSGSTLSRAFMDHRICVFLHIPIDQYILKIAEKELGVKVPIHSSWSRWSESEYKKYQKELVRKIHPVLPLKWEFKAWLQSKKNDE